MKKITKRGISLLELMIIICIVAVLVAIIFINLSKFRNERTLHNTTEDIISLINEARNSTISSLNSNNYSIHFEADQVVLFAGSTFIENEASNKKIDLSSPVEISEDDGINLNGGGEDIIFERITGNTENYGTIKIQLTSNNNRSQIVNINKLGIVSKN